jgi:outer membrane lipoprotein-sorting protein
MKRIASVTGFFFIAVVLWAQIPQEEIFRNPLNPQTNDAFILTCSRIAEHSFTRGNFEQVKTLSKTNRSLKSSGNFIIAVGLGMVWDTAKPFRSTVTLGKDFIIQSRPGGQKTVLNAQGNETFLRMAEVISAVFSGNSKELMDNFDVYYVGNTAAWEIGLSPINSSLGSFAEKIVMKGDAAIRSIIIYEQNGDTTQYNLSNHSYPLELNVNEKAFFSFS